MKILSVIGARPQFVKIAPVSKAIQHYRQTSGRPLEDVIVHTGQHYDPEMSDVFFKELGIPEARCNLEVGSGRQGWQTGRMLERIENVLLDIDPQIVVVYGDTNSTVAGALAASKLHIPVAHVEAGLRSFNRRMPEEINRVVTDHMADLLLASTPTAVSNLEKEGLTGRTTFSGDIMVETVLAHRRIANQRSRMLEQMQLRRGEFGVVTIHRAENTDDKSRLGDLLRAIQDIAARDLPLVFPVHPRTRGRIDADFPAVLSSPGLKVIEPVGYLDMLCLLDHAALVLTDSGGLQKEAFVLDCPCVTLREETEWVETVDEGGNILAGVVPEEIRAAVHTTLSRFGQDKGDFSAALGPVFGVPGVAERIVDTIVGHLDASR